MKLPLLRLACYLPFTMLPFVSMGATSTNIRIKAAIDQGACTPSLDNGGVLEFGDFPVSHLYTDTPSGLDTRSINMHITCTAPVVVGYSFQDNRQDTLDGGSADIQNYGFGIGLTPEEVHIGHFYLYVADSSLPTPVVNNTPARTIYSDNGGTQWQLASSSTKASNSGSNIMAFSSTDDFSRPLAVETATATLSVHPVVQSLKTLALTDDQPYEGQATLNLVYL